MKHNWIIWAAITMHLIYGVLLIRWESSAGSTFTRDLINALGCSAVVGIVILIIAIMALLGLISGKRHGVFSIGMLVPQQILLGVHFISAVRSIADPSLAAASVPVPVLLIGFLPMMVLAVWHQVAIVSFHNGDTGRIVWRALRTIFQR